MLKNYKMKKMLAQNEVVDLKFTRISRKRTVAVACPPKPVAGNFPQAALPHLAKIKANYKGKYDDLTCDVCKEDQGTIEHIVSCKEYKRMFKGTKETQVMDKTSTTELLRIAQYAGEIEQYKQRFDL